MVALPIIIINSPTIITVYSAICWQYLLYVIVVNKNLNRNIDTKIDGVREKLKNKIYER